MHTFNERSTGPDMYLFLVALTILLMPAKWYHAVILYAVSEILWVVGHGVTFSALKRWYNK